MESTDRLSMVILVSERTAAHVRGDRRTGELINRQIALLEELPVGFRIQRTRTHGVGLGPSLGLVLEDERYPWLPSRVVGTCLARAGEARPLIAWSRGDYGDPISAIAHCVMVRFAVLDAERCTWRAKRERWSD